MRFAAIVFSPCASEATVRRLRPCDPGKFPWPRPDPAFPVHHAHARDSLSHFFCINSALDFSRPQPNAHVVVIFMSTCTAHPTIHDGAMLSLSTLHPDHSGNTQSLVVTGVSIPFTAFSFMPFD